ncbi:hypothetical protein [Serratia fonticola]|uniref:hypothetical protein n=1 Tax=Serratia fonticola TaxID=47917 RepID=UPI0014153378|nr:hypothetical protein [Serratia fonticola]QIP89875.1 hypothetical protein HAP32_00392 [Serratia fonticola]
MDDKPFIYLLNTNESVAEKLKAQNYNAHSIRMNGIKNYNVSNSSLYIEYEANIPLDLHEADVIVLDTTVREGFITNGDSKTTIGYDTTPRSVNLLPLDINLASQNIFSNSKEQVIIVFCVSNSTENYLIRHDGAKLFNKITCQTYNFGYNIKSESRSGRRFQKPQNKINSKITELLLKYSEGSSYSVVLERGFNSDVALLENEGGEVVSMMRDYRGKHLLLFPDISEKEEFLLELFSTTLPNESKFSDFFPVNEEFLWCNDFLYISSEEKIKTLEIEDEINRHELSLHNLRCELDCIKSKPENVNLKNLLKETDDELVNSVKWFLEYIGFENIENPDDTVVIEDGDVYEEDLRITLPEITYIIEVKGIGGTSKDAYCQQVSKIVNRKRHADRTINYHGVYIVNHQRYRSPKDRERIPFNENQIEDAEIASRGMTFTFELFNVYHMIEMGFLTKEAVRQAFKHDGLINFKESIPSIVLNHCYGKASVYSFDLDKSKNITLSVGGKIAVLDNEACWHLLEILSIQIDKEDVEVASKGLVGVKVNRIVEGAREFHLIKQ